jgi:hypothetical protein
MRHRAIRLSSPTADRSRCRPVRPPGAAISAAVRAARMPDGRPSVRIAAASGDLVFGYEERIR